MHPADGKNDNVALMRERCEGLRVEPRREVDDAEIARLQDTHVGSFSSVLFESQHTTCLVARNGRGLEGSVAIKRAAYEQGVEIPYDGRGNYINKIEFLATSQPCPNHLPAALAAHAILAVGGTNLFVVEVAKETAARVFENMRFSRICTCGDKTRYGYLLKHAPRHPAPVQPETRLSHDEYLARLTENENQYHAVLRARTGFDIVQLVSRQWTTYQQYGNHFFLTVTFGQARHPPQTAFKCDIFNLADGVHVGYCDVVIPENTEFALQDDAVKGFLSCIPSDAEEFLGAKPSLNIRGANDIRTGWPTREGIWVRVDYRRAGIGQTLERVAGDICKLAFPKIKTIGVIFPVDNPRTHEFHRKACARDVNDPLYCLEYRLDDLDKPRVSIRYGL
jgi:hypothetical protein